MPWLRPGLLFLLVLLLDTGRLLSVNSGLAITHVERSTGCGFLARSSQSWAKVQLAPNRHLPFL